MTDSAPIDPRTLSGLELLRWMRDTIDDETTPSIRRLLGMRFDVLEEGRVVISADTQPDFSNRLGTTHGGIHATLLDSVMGCSVHTMLPAGVGYTSLELKVNYLRPVGLDGQTMRAEGNVIHLGRRTATAEGRIVDQDGKLVAHGTTTCLVIRPEGERGWDRTRSVRHF